MTRLHGIKSHMLERELHSGTSKTKQLVPVHLDLPLFWKSHCAVCVPECVVTGSCKGPIAMATFGAKFLDTINKSKAHDCKRNLSPTILKGNQMVYSWNKEIISLMFYLNSNNFRRLKARKITLYKNFAKMRVKLLFNFTLHHMITRANSPFRLSYSSCTLAVRIKCCIRGTRLIYSSHYCRDGSQIFRPKVLHFRRVADWGNLMMHFNLFNSVFFCFLQGSHSTKVEAVVRTLLTIKSSDSTAKCLVFSTVSS